MRSSVAYDVLARGAGYPRAFAFTELDAFTRDLPGILRAPGPVFVTAKVFPEIENEPISHRVRWRKRTADKVVQDSAHDTNLARVAGLGRKADRREAPLRRG